MAKQTIGGNRLGSGGKMEVDGTHFNRSTHDLSYIWRSTMSAGTLVPFMVEVGLPGDTFDIDLDAYINTHPTIGPLFGTAKVQLDVFQCPIRLYHKALHQNKLGIGLKMNTIKLPQLNIVTRELDYTKNLDNQQINPSALLSYLNIRGAGDGGVNGATRQFNALPLISYWSIYKQYYANKQEEIGAFISNETQIIPSVVAIAIYAEHGSTAITLPTPPAPTIAVRTTRTTYLNITHNGTKPDYNTIKIIINNKNFTINEVFNTINEYGANDTNISDIKPEFIGRIVSHWRYTLPNELTQTAPRVITFPLENIDTIQDNILEQPISSPYTITDQTLAPYGTSLPALGQAYSPLLSSQEGLAIKTYQSDLLNNWMQTEWLDGTNGINEITAVDTSSGNFKIDALNLAKKVYDMLNHIAISGGTFNDWVEQVYGHTPMRKPENPIYEGGLIKELVFEEVISNSNSATPDTNQPLGTLAGKGRLGEKHKGGKITIHVDEHSYIIGIISITPRVDYSQGNKWDVNLKTMDDFHKPHLDEIGFQDLITEQMAWWDTKYDYGNTDEWVQNSAGKQPAWMNYMTNLNQVRGNFAIEDNEMFMTFNRRYEHDATGRIKDLTTYIDPVKFNQIFAQTSLDAQNYWVQIGCNITARRKMSARIMPNL